ncbi:MAG: hypothetical protein AB1630_04140 [bacterium]
MNRSFQTTLDPFMPQTIEEALEATRPSSLPREEELTTYYIPRSDKGYKTFRSSLLSKVPLGGGFRGLLSGQRGVGKTTVILRFAKEIREFITIRYLEAGDYLDPTQPLNYEAILFLLNCGLKGGRVEAIETDLKKLSRNIQDEESALGRPFLIVIDGLDRRTKELAQLMNEIGAQLKNLFVRLLFTAQPAPEWAETKLVDIFDSIDFLPGLPTSSSLERLPWIEEVVRRRVKENILDDKLLKAIGFYSAGIPREALVNTHRSLQNTMKEGILRLTPSHLTQILDERANRLLARANEDMLNSLKLAKEGSLADKTSLYTLLFYNLLIQYGDTQPEYKVHPIIARALKWGYHEL